ncbi:glutamine amidotransferase [Hydrogenispora ethanolica]|jgi:glutamine amidotransferase|uniref:Imidazole glycerol phosphate synthase subunit HisH n=1 Tax=Hydrogenispora ethanolica TaxID=1082276 RepID=A0A4R1REJ8_HYDET|nr:imidazole glycerol phosphate synthase subunit HisH [Hydrogenispora ethanolica]TCL64269.1 glutamine amidotransferase [Hydrogenispora ethanolica]
MIAIIDYGVGNLRSVAKAFEFLGFSAQVTSDPELVREAERVVLPGVGAFGKSMESLEKAGMVPVVREVIASGRPFLGICLGLQLLFEESFEVFGNETSSFKGLGIFPGRVLRFPAGELKVPQIGWNQIQLAQDTPLFHKVQDGSFVYFVHSYYVKPTDPRLTACETHYAIDYCSGIARENVFAVQFHPEKSSQVGLQILRNFAELRG